MKYSQIMILSIIVLLITSIVIYRYWNDSAKKEAKEKLNIVNDLLIDGVSTLVIYSDEYTDLLKRGEVLSVNTEYVYKVDGKEYKGSVSASNVSMLIDQINRDSVIVYNPKDPKIRSFSPEADYDKYYNKAYSDSDEDFPTWAGVMFGGALLAFIYAFIGIKYNFW